MAHQGMHAVDLAAQLRAANDVILNLMAVVDTPLGRRKLGTPFDEEARQWGRRYLEEFGLQNPSVPCHSVGLTIVRLSIPGNACTYCGSIMGEPLRCPGCGHADPPTRRP